MARRTTAILGIIIGLLVLGLAGTVLYYRSFTTTGTQAETAKLPDLPAREIDSKVLAKYYPRHWDSYQKNNITQTEPSKWGGSEQKNKLEQSPHMVGLWQGYGFSKEYLEDRGHTYAMIDVTETGRKPTKAVCLTCKSTKIPGLIEEMGTDFYTASFAELAPQMMDYPIGCSDCHNTDTMELTITRPALVEALKLQDIEVKDLTRNQMRTMVCAQCHVEYHVRDGVLEFPWKYGWDPEEELKYYEEINFADFTQTDSQIKQLKAQHPDFEMFTDSVHYAAGVSCADCHMPYVTEGNVKVTSHWWTSPLRHLEQSCMVCHRWSAEELTERVFYTQDRVNDILNRAGDMNLDIVEKITAAREMAGVDTALLDEAIDLQRQAQWYWDWVGAENSMGFHNPAKAFNALGRSLDLAGKSLAKIVAATQGKVGTE